MKKRGVFRYSEFVGVRLDSELLAALERIAEEEDRPLASLIRIALREWIAEHVETPPRPRKKKSPPA